jgi:hypothetical protein
MKDAAPLVSARSQHKTSPILDEDEEMSLFGTGNGVCYFNDVAYPIGQCVRSGELLRCEQGVWVRKVKYRPIDLLSFS